MATRQVAEKLDVPLIDLQVLTEQWVNALGDEASKEMYLWTDITSPRFPEPRKDDTHLSIEGAHKVSQMATEVIRKIIPELGKNLEPDIENN